MRKGRRIVEGGLRIVYRPNELGHGRLGLAVSRKYGGAVRRNRLKRVLREAFRTGEARRMPVDFLVIPLWPAERMRDPAGDFRRAVARIAERLA